MKMPEACSTTGKNVDQNETIKSTCKPIRDWVTVRGVSDDAATMKNFRVADEKNVSLSDIDTNLVVFDKFEKSMASPEHVKEAEAFAKMVFAAMENDTVKLEDLLK